MKATPSPDPTPPDPPAPPEPTTSVPSTPSVSPSPAEPPRPATWPEWFGAADVALAVLVGVMAFLATSFAARNPDVWLHLANGRLLAKGEYRPGADSFSYTGADRAWADTSWLFDLGAYALYSADPSGGLVVGVKALAFLAAFGLLMLLRRPGHAIWPWAGLLGLAVLSAAPYAALRPIVGSMLFLSLTVLILYRGAWRPGSWREPGILAGLFWVWANTDSWFLLGPLTLAVVWLGEKLNPLLGREVIAESDADPVFWPAPSGNGLGRALLLGVVACLLNPMFLAAAVRDPGEALNQLVPAEFGLALPPGAAEDPDLYPLTARPFTEEFFWFRANQPDEQIKLSSIAFTALFVVSALALAAGYRRLRATHILLWVAFGLLAFVHVRLIAFFAIVVAPLAAAHLNGLSAYLRLGTWADTPTRLTLTGSALGRVLSLAAAMAAVGAAYPGWLHSPAADPAYANRVEWAVVADAGLARAAENLPKLRASGNWPDSLRGLAPSLEFGNYCAWFAPGEKVFANSRYTFHRHELPDLLMARQGLIGRRSQSAEAAESADLWQVCDTHGAGFVVHTTPSYRQLGEHRIFELLLDEDRWVLWHLDGRSALIGRRTAELDARRFRFDPARAAFGPDAEPIPEGKAIPQLLPPEPGWGEFWASYLARPEPLPPSSDDATVLATYAAFTAERDVRRWQTRLRGHLAARSALVGVTAAGMLGAEQMLIEDEQLALPVVCVRAARRAVAAAPDRPEVYHALAVAYRQRYAPVLDLPMPRIGMTEHQLQMTAALARFLARVPPPDRCSAAMARTAFFECRNLAQAYHDSGQFDLARDALRRSVEYARVLPPAFLAEVVPLGAKTDDPARTILKALEDEEERLSRVVQRQLDLVSRQTGASRKFRAAADGGLPGRAIQIFKDVPDPNEFGADKLWVVVQMITLELRAGRVEEAAADLAELDSQIQSLAARQPNDPVVLSLKSLQGIKARLEGNYPAAGEVLNQADLPPIDPPLARQALTAPHAMLGLAAIGGTTVPLFGTTEAQKTRAPLATALLRWLGAREAVLLESTYQYDRGLLALCDANLAEAERRFAQALQPQGVDVSTIGDQERLDRAKRYLALIRKYKGSGSPGARP